MLMLHDFLGKYPKFQLVGSLHCDNRTFTLQMHGNLKMPRTKTEKLISAIFRLKTVLVVLITPAQISPFED